MKLYKDYYFPDYDTECHPAVFKEAWKIPEIIFKCKGVDNCIQAGGNVGVFPIILSNFFNRVFTFEPDMLNYNCLVNNINKHSINNVVHKYCGLGNKITKAEVFQPENVGNCGSLALTEKEEGEVNIMTLDSLINSSLKIDLIYLDIEGYERKALEGAVNIIKEHKPVIVLENKGLIPEFGPVKFKPEGSEELRHWMVDFFNYKFDSRLMRDDIFLPI